MFTNVSWFVFALGLGAAGFMFDPVVGAVALVIGALVRVVDNRRRS